MTQYSTPEHEGEALADYRALFWRRHWIAVILILALFSLAGLPPTAGLVGKILIAVAGIEAQLWPLLFMLVLGSVISVYYYLRLAITMFRRDQTLEAQKLILPSHSPVLQITLILMGSVIVILGVYPYPLIHLIEQIL